MSVIPDEEEVPLQWWHKIENGIATAILAVMVLVPVVTVINRWITGEAWASSNLWVQALNLWIAFLGGAIAARTGSHLALSTGNLFKKGGQAHDLVAGFTSAVGTAVTAMLAYASASYVISETGSTLTLSGNVPMWALMIVMPVGFFIMAIRLAIKGNRTWPGRAVALVAVGLACSMAFVPAGERGWLVWLGTAILLFAVALGAPLFTCMGGIAMLLFFGAPIAVRIAAVPLATSEIIANPNLAALPLFTLAGYLLAEGGASKRLVRLFQVWFDWLPGGVAAAAVLVCAFFTTFTGASGVTILALGGLLLPALKGAGYTEKFAVGLLVASGSIGLLFPPSLPVILYGVASNVPIPDLFIGGIVPGCILVSLLVGMSVIVSFKDKGFAYWFTIENKETDAGKVITDRLVQMLKSAWEAKFELGLPAWVLIGYFGGFLTIFEAAAFTAAYAFFTEVVIHRDLHITKDVPKVFVECATLMGGVLIILGVAMGFTNYLVDAEVPMTVASWVEAHVANKLLFILALNVLLLVVGCLMDIYSAIMVVVPLIIPVAAVFGIHPVHLGILFLANLELGYLTPPIGLNLFLASFRFKLPLTQVYRYALPFLGVMAIGVLIIAYVPITTTWAFPDDYESPSNFFEDDLLEPLEPTTPPMIPPGDLMKMLDEGDDDDDGPPAMPSPEEMMKMLEEDGPPAMPSPEEMMKMLEEEDGDE
ncbi:MAG: TRAP transporter large permease subunit [Proteobacteria bacterium]|nr:TRAP transporter large permease subunit [Pseudomonadota bacterium]